MAWTEITRRHYTREGLRYGSDTTDAEWFVMTRKPCADFQKYKPLFQKIQQELEANIRTARPFELKSEIEPDRYFIVNGQVAYVAEKGEVFTNDQSRRDARLRLIFDNGTESNMLMRSLQRQLHADPAGRRITDPDVGPLFGSSSVEGDLDSGTIYVLRSNCNDTRIADHREVIHKIGVTGNDVESRIASARVDPTFLLYRLQNSMNRMMGGGFFRV